MKLALLALGLFEKSDSVGYDCAYQYRQIKKLHIDIDEIRVFAETYDQSIYPDIPIEGTQAFYDWCGANPDGIVIFHYCDSRSRFDDFLRARRAPTIIRWHNNTPPWFNFGSQNQYAAHSLAGFENLLNFIACKQIRFWVNSNFTRDQLLALGGSAARCSTVFPASRYLEPGGVSLMVRRNNTFAAQSLNLLFVGRVVAHKGHQDAISTAAQIKAAFDKPVKLVFAGRTDPGLVRFNARLRDIAANSGVEVNFHGEVSEERLASLYSNADVFLCLSGHEGFGLPVFEAMRCRLPVVAWASTALEELLVAHPLAFKHYDINAFAAAVLALQNPAVHAHVLEAQHTVLAQYTPMVIEKQLSAALASLQGNWGQPLPGNLSSRQLLEHPVLGEKLAAWVGQANDQAAQQGIELAHDSGRNLVSLYDLIHYRSFLNAQRKRHFALLERQHEVERVVNFQPEEFAARFGTVESGALRLPTGNYPSDHLIYGPYVEFPRGKYDAEFQFSFESTTDDIEFELDVNCADVGVLARIFVGQKSYPAGIPDRLSFEIEAEESLTEFRLRPMRPFTGSLTFNGVRISPASARALAVPIVPDQIRTPRLPWRYLSGRVARKRAAYHFSRGDCYRDAGQWLEAADEYGKGLALRPTEFPYLVQRGHAFKEAKHMQEAELCYRQALALCQDDPDLLLHLGHFYKVNGKTSEAAEFYFRAISKDAIAIDAAEELSRLHASLPELRARIHA